MMKQKFITRIAITCNPPIFKFEYTKGQRRDKYHKHIRLERYVDSSLHSAVNSTEKPINVSSIVTAIADRHEELRQIPQDTMEQVIEKLLTIYKSYLVSELSQSVDCHHIDKSSEVTSKSTAFDETGRAGYSEDLNEVGDEVLSMAKNEMNVTFQKYQILPDNDRYEYDKRVNFYPDEDSSWD